MENLEDLFEAISSSSMDEVVKNLLKQAVVVESQDKPISALEKLIDEHLGETGT